MRIGFVTQWYDPEQGSALVPGTLARGLSSRGFDVEVVTGFPNFPLGTIYPGFRQRLYSREVRDGITVHRVPLFPDHSNRASRRGASYATFALTSTILGMPTLSHVDAHLVYGSPVTSGLSLALTRAARSKPLVTYASDLWPDSVLGSGIAPTGRSGPTVSRLVGAAANAVYSRSDALVATTAFMRDELHKRYPKVQHVSLIYNWVDESLFGPINHPRIETLLPDLGGAVVAMYAGTMGHAQAPMRWMEVARCLQHRDDIVFVFVGSGPLKPQMESFSAFHELKNVHFLGQCSVKQSAALIASSSLQLISLHETPYLDYTLPSKVQASMASGIPIVSVAGGETARIVAASECGIGHPTFNAFSVAESIATFANMSAHERFQYGERGRRYYGAHMSAAVGTRELAQVFTRVNFA